MISEGNYKYNWQDITEISYTSNELGAQPSNFKTNNKMKQILSEQWTLSLRDFLRGAVRAVLAACIPLLQQQTTNHVFDWSVIGWTALSTFVASLAFAFFAPTTVIETKPSQAKVDSLKQ